jgi:hypothetical protein
MDITADYNIPQSTDFADKFQNGIGVSANINYFYKETGFSGSLLFGFNSFRAKSSFEEEFKNNNTTLFEYKYELNYYTFPLMLAANYTFFNKKKFNITLSFGAGGNFMEYKQKQIGEYTSDTEKNYFNEFAIYPNLGFSYYVTKDIAILLKSGYNMTFGDQNISYIDFKFGVTYKI